VVANENFATCGRVSLPRREEARYRKEFRREGEAREADHSWVPHAQVRGREVEKYVELEWSADRQQEEQLRRGRVHSTGAMSDLAGGRRKEGSSDDDPSKPQKLRCPVETAEDRNEPQQTPAHRRREEMKQRIEGRACSLLPLDTRGQKKSPARIVYDEEDAKDPGKS